MKRTKEEIAAEVAALKNLKPVGAFARKTQATIDATIEALEDGIDETAEEWNELSDDAQSSALDAMRWRDGDTDEKPSESFTGLVA